MSNRTGPDDVIPRCTNTDRSGVCMYAGPCLECSNARARYHAAALPVSAVDRAVAAALADAGDADSFGFSRPDIERLIRHSVRLGVHLALDVARAEARGEDRDLRITSAIAGLL